MRPRATWSILAVNFFQLGPTMWAREGPALAVSGRPPVQGHGMNLHGRDAPAHIASDPLPVTPFGVLLP